jgi:peptidoglycan hydrolase-like amidase
MHIEVEVVVKWVRAVLLLGLLAYFAVSLVIGLARDESAGGFGRQHQDGSQDPGVRVLLANRSNKATEPSRGFERIEWLTILQTVDVVTPDDPGNGERRLVLRGGAKLLVLLAEGTDGMVLSSTEWAREVTWPVSRIRVVPHTTAPALTEVEAKAGLGRRDPLFFEAADNDAVFMFQGRRYRGSAEIIWRGPKEMLLVNVLPLEAYVQGVIAVEMSPSYPLEALKAQAIVSRSSAYAHAWTARTARQPFDLSDGGDDDQDYRGTGNGTGLISRAGFETRGIITCTGQSNGIYVFAPDFCASSGGYTAGIESVLPDPRDAQGRPLPLAIMPAQPDPYCQAGAEGLGDRATHWQTTVVLRGTDIRAGLIRLCKLNNDSRPIGFTKDLRVGRRDPRSNRVETVLIHHTQGDPIELPAHVFRMILRDDKDRPLLHSTLWSPDSPSKIDSPDKLTKLWKITCVGYGHGVGMSQISAWEMARQGLSARSILGFFYPGVVLRTMW